MHTKISCFEAGIYEIPEVWTLERYSRKEELIRFEACASLIPESIESLVDIGCGNGAFLACLEKKHHGKFLGIDRARAAIQSRLCKTPLFLGSAENLPFKDKSFDMAVALEVIEHLTYNTYHLALKEIERVARDHILISVPYKEKRIAIQCPACHCKFDPHYHMRTFDEKILENLFESFRVVKFDYISIDVQFLGHDFYKLYRTVLPDKDFPSFTVCPQCGFKSQHRYVSTNPVLFKGIRGSLRKKLKSLWPKYKKVNWVSAFYEKRRP